MRKLLGPVTIGLIAMAGSTAVLACGDKVLSLGHNPRFKLAERPASVLLYGGSKERKTTLGSKELQSALKQAGHKLEIVDDVAKLEMDLTSGKFDVALVDYGDAITLAEHVNVRSATAVIIPVMGKGAKTESTGASKEFTYLVKSSDPWDYIATIDRAMKSRSRK
jgi:hypothetical protein